MQKNKGESRAKPIRVTLFLFLTLAISSIPQSSCTLIDYLYVDCDKCYTNKPEYALQKLFLTINDENPEVFVTVYIGPYESNNIYLDFKSLEKEKLLNLRTDTHYTIRAEYKKRGRTYYVIDGCIIKVKKDDDSCTKTCYYLIEKHVDLRLVF